MELSKLKPNPKNPRIIKDDKYKKLVKSLQEFPEMMEKRPMVCVTDADGKIYPLGGNMRLRALQELKYKEIPDSWVSFADEWSEEKRKEFTIKDNVSFGEHDWDELANSWDRELLSDWGVDVLLWDDDFKIIENNELGNSQNKNDVYGGNSLPVRIGNYIGYMQDSQLSDFMELFTKKTEKEDEKESQQYRNEVSIRIVSLIKDNEDIILG